MPVFSPKDAYYAYEPVSVPEYDADGNIIGYYFPKVMPCTLDESETLRIHSSPNELGASADPSNVDGFGAAVEIINANRNLKTSGLSPVGQDDANMMQQVSEALKVSKKE